MTENTRYILAAWLAVLTLATLVGGWWLWETYPEAARQVTVVGVAVLICVVVFVYAFVLFGTILEGLSDGKKQD